MAFNGSGTFNLAAGNPVTTGTTISSTWANSTLSDVATGLTNCITRDGQSTPLANIPMGNYKLTGLGQAAATGDALAWGKNASVVDLAASGTVSGTGFSNYLASPPAIGSTTASTGAFTTLSASSTVSGTGFSNYLASPPAIGSTTASTGAFTTLSASSTVSGTGFSNYLASPPAIGSTTASTGAFTTLSASSTVTLSGGTANGVGYLNASKVFTTGSALTFDGTKFTQTASTAGILSEFVNSSSANQNGNIVATNDGGTKVRLQVFGSAAGSYGMLAANSSVLYTSGADLNIVADNASGVIKFGLSGSTEKMRIDSSGNLLVGTTVTTGTPVSGFTVLINSGSSYINVAHVNGTSSGTGYQQFVYNSGLIGSITQNGTTGVLYNITSDYRLKDVVGVVTNSGSRIDALEPIDYTMKSDGSAHKGFLAHKFQEVYPNSVTGEKDAVDKDGNPVYQCMQAGTAEVIADLVAEIQSLRKRIATLEAK